MEEFQLQIFRSRSYLCCKGFQLVEVVWWRFSETPGQEDQLGEGVDGVEELDLVFVSKNEVANVLKLNISHFKKPVLDH